MFKKNLDPCHRCGTPPTMSYYPRLHEENLLTSIECNKCGRGVIIFKNIKTHKLIESWNSFAFNKMQHHIQGD